MAKRFPRAPAGYDQKTFELILRDIENRLDRLDAAVSKYTITNAPADSRTIDWGAATDTEKLDFLVTVIADMQKRGWLGR